jgi:hypothetical protein
MPALHNRPLPPAPAGPLPGRQPCCKARGSAPPSPCRSPARRTATQRRRRPPAGAWGRRGGAARGPGEYGLRVSGNKQPGLGAGAHRSQRCMTGHRKHSAVTDQTIGGALSQDEANPASHIKRRRRPMLRPACTASPSQSGGWPPPHRPASSSATRPGCARCAWNSAKERRSMSSTWGGGVRVGRGWGVCRGSRRGQGGAGGVDARARQAGLRLRRVQTRALLHPAGPAPWQWPGAAPNPAGPAPSSPPLPPSPPPPHPPPLHPRPWRPLFPPSRAP